MAGAARGSRVDFGAPWLEARLRELLPAWPGVSLCVAFSAGADSTALLAALAPLRAQGVAVRAVHVDHGLQPAAADFRRQARRTAAALKVPLRVIAVRVPRTGGESPEAAAREARYAALAAALAPGECLLTAHHEDDQLETVLLQLLRGAGVAGLAAMPGSAPCGQGLLVRPLLGVEGGALRAWLQGQALGFAEDPSNADERFDRNYLRRRVLPLLRARWPAAAATVARGARHAGEAQLLLDELARADCERAQVGAALDAKVLRRLGLPRRRNALRWWIARAGWPRPPARRLAELAGPVLAARPDTHPFTAWAGVRAARHADLLYLEPARGTPTAGLPAGLEWHWRAAPVLELPGGAGTLSLEPDPRGPLDLEALAPVLTVRARSGGERLRLVPGGVRRSLKGLLQEARVPREVRTRLPLVFSGAVLVAVADLYLDATVQAGERTRQRGRLRLRAGGAV